MNKFSKTIIVILIATFLLIIMCYISNKKESSYSTQINQELYEDNLVDTICENIKKDSLGESKEKDLDQIWSEIVKLKSVPMNFENRSGGKIEMNSKSVDTNEDDYPWAIWSYLESNYHCLVDTVK